MIHFVVNGNGYVGMAVAPLHPKGARAPLAVQLLGQIAGVDEYRYLVTVDASMTEQMEAFSNVVRLDDRR